MTAARIELASQQSAFMAQVLSDDAPVPAHWGERQAAGMEIYRHAYRTRLVDALRDTYERTAAYVGEDAFRQAAAHHLITHPPTSWTLDDAGELFPETLAQLFPHDPEVAELGWLEEAMHRVFVARDVQPLDAAGFASAAALFRDEDWEMMRLSFLPALEQRDIAHNIGLVWRAVNDSASDMPDITLPDPLSLVVWREDIKPVFIQVDAVEGAALAMMRGGASYGAMCNVLVDRLGEEQAVARAGEILGRWLQNGFITALHKA